ncbi:hypothetical protein [Planctomyces sp. SH-PL62]|uniref:hypothetical protein n=1 Tax=Planctomyces sp. SH-PL62 TaxID=1636152 RepID=UPI00078C1338|nr:hypothetical protein [Planctomyces sp. SH-PL62]AMV36784.1 hypothetical protein VT85_05090 [Planctomyces sp. SH-PL62]
MNSNRRRWIRTAASGLVALGLLLAAAPTTVRAQEDPAAEGESSGRPLDGYFGTLILAAGAFFIIGKSARR